MVLLFLLLCWGLAASQRSINPAEFPKTTELITDLGDVSQKSTSLETCIKKVTSPLDQTVHFGDEVATIDGKITTLVKRTESIVDILDSVMLIPYVGQVATFVLQPAVVALKEIKTGLSKVKPDVQAFANKMHAWIEPLKAVMNKIHWVENSIDKFAHIVTIVDGKAAAAEGCVNSLPVGRTPAIHALEGVSGKLDVVPDGFGEALGTVNTGCSKIEGFLGEFNLVSKLRTGLASLEAVNRVLDTILHAFGPLGDFLDEVNAVLEKKFCLLHSVEKLAEEGEKVAQEVGKGVVNAGKTVANGVNTAVHKVGNFFHNIFGRREVVENLYFADGKLYVLVNGSVETRTRDVCLSLSDILKGVNAVTGGLMNTVKGLIDGLFHGKSPFKIPGLTGDVLNIGSLFHNLDFGGLIPYLKDFLELPQGDMENIINLNAKLFEQTLPQCAAVFAKFDMQG